MIGGEIRAKMMAFGQEVVVTGGYGSGPAVQCGATVTTAPTHQPLFFVALIRTYTRVHKQFASLVCSVSHSHLLSLSSSR